MKTKILSYSFVGIWKQLFSQIPILDNTFSKDIFKDPYNTISGISPNGFVITLQDVFPAKTVLFNTQRIEISSVNLHEVSEILIKILKEFDISTNNSTEFANLGFNFELEVDLGQKADNWIKNSFFGNLISKNQGINIIGKAIHFDIAVQQKRYDVLIEPRLSQENAIFIKINDHIVESYKFEKSRDVENFFNDSYKEIESSFLPKLIS
jgi:hypothetical protein